MKQIVVYGANGWLGRSAIAAALELSPDLSPKSILLLGSKKSNITIRGRNFEIKDSHAGQNLIEEDAIFINCAFLRREHIYSLGEKEFESRNRRIMDFPINVLRNRTIFNFVNLSSGVAASVSNIDDNFSQDMYAILKKQGELELAHETEKTGSRFLNCRVYSVSGIYLNEYENLALSLFIAQALKSEPITVRSPESMRTYIDGINLMTVLLKLAFNGEMGNYDSGGVCVTIKQLAQTVSRVVDDRESEIILGEEKESSYVGDFEKFNELSIKLGVKILDLDEQVRNTLMAFRD